jgi:hypothetical protein
VVMIPRLLPIKCVGDNSAYPSRPDTAQTRLTVSRLFRCAPGSSLSNLRLKDAALQFMHKSDL